MFHTASWLRNLNRHGLSYIICPVLYVVGYVSSITPPLHLRKMFQAYQTAKNFPIKFSALMFNLIISTYFLHANFWFPPLYSRTMFYILSISIYTFQYASYICTYVRFDGLWIPYMEGAIFHLPCYLQSIPVQDQWLFARQLQEWVEEERNVKLLGETTHILFFTSRRVFTEWISDPV